MGLDTLLKGKQKTYKADGAAESINRLATMGMNRMRSAAYDMDAGNKNPQLVVQNQIGLENKLMRGSAQDANRRTQDLIAQRGMGASSIGLGQQVNQEKMLNDRIVMNNASTTSRIMDIGREKINLGNSLFALKAGQGPIQMNTIKKREGGLAGLIGAGVGAYYGGPGGAQAGQGMGEAYANS